METPYYGLLDASRLSVAIPNSGLLWTTETSRFDRKNWFWSRWACKEKLCSPKGTWGRAAEEMNQSCISCLKTLLMSLNLLCWVSCLITERYYKTECKKSIKAEGVEHMELMGCTLESSEASMSPWQHTWGDVQGKQEPQVESVCSPRNQTPVLHVLHGPPQANLEDGQSGTPPSKGGGEQPMDGAD